jgi:hypothetical protein
VWLARVGDAATTTTSAGLTPQNCGKPGPRGLRGAGPATRCRSEKAHRRHGPGRRWAIAPAAGGASHASLSSTPVWASGAKRSGTPQCSTMRLSTTRATSSTVKSTGRRLGAPKEGAGGRSPGPDAHPDRVAVLHGVLDGEGDVGDGAVHVGDLRRDVLQRSRSGARQPELVLHEVRSASSTVTCSLLLANQVRYSSTSVSGVNRLQ